MVPVEAPVVVAPLVLAAVDPVEPPPPVTGPAEVSPVVPVTGPALVGPSAAGSPSEFPEHPLARAARQATRVTDPVE